MYYKQKKSFKIKKKNIFPLGALFIYFKGIIPRHFNLQKIKSKNRLNDSVSDTLFLEQSHLILGVTGV